MGSGARPAASDTVTVHYAGTLLDGTEFDSSLSRGEPATFPLQNVIPGWTEGLQLMPVGSKFKFFIPANLAYGPNGPPSIGPNATLIFEIELLDVTAAITLGEATPDALLRAQTDGVVIIDIRREDEWRETGVIEGAETITAFQASGRVDPDFLDNFRQVAPSPDTPIMLYCRSGSRTTSLGNALIEQLGFTDVTHLSGGITGWLDGGNPTVDYTP